MIKLAKYSTIFILAMFHSLKNYKALIGLNLFLIICLLIFSNIWKVSAAKIGMIHLHHDQLLWYIALNEWVLIAIPNVQMDIEYDFRNGRLAYFLPRPISYLGMIFFEGLGILCINLLTLGLFAFLFIWFRTGIFHFDVFRFVIFGTLGILAGAVGMIFQMLITSVASLSFCNSVS